MHHVCPTRCRTKRPANSCNPAAGSLATRARHCARVEPKSPNAAPRICARSGAGRRTWGCGMTTVGKRDCPQPRRHHSGRSSQSGSRGGGRQSAVPCWSTSWLPPSSSSSSSAAKLRSLRSEGLMLALIVPRSTGSCRSSPPGARITRGRQVIDLWPGWPCSRLGFRVQFLGLSPPPCPRFARHNSADTMLPSALSEGR